MFQGSSVTMNETRIIFLHLLPLLGKVIEVTFSFRYNKRSTLISEIFGKTFDTIH